MKKILPKIKIALVFLAAVFAFNALSQTALAKLAEPVSIQVPLPGMSKTITIDENSLGNYIKVIYNYAIAIVGIVSALAMMIAGAIWITAGGNASRVDDAKSRIGSALTGLVLAMTSYLILYTVNPDLITFRPLDIKDATGYANKVEEKNSCCGYYNNAAYKDYFSSCTPVSDIGQCDLDYGTREFFEGQDCSTISKCPFCSNRSNGTECGQDELCRLSTDSDREICWKNECVCCEPDEGDPCNTTPCCGGDLVCCDIPYWQDRCRRTADCSDPAQW